MTLTAGDIFAKRFVIRGVLGKGGFATVYAATDTQSSVPVALKLISPEGLDGIAATKKRFEREAAALQQAINPHIVALVDHGEDSGLLYLAFEELPGEDLRDVLDRRTSLKPLEISDILGQLCDGLAPLHALNVVHRDLKPENIRVIRQANGRWFCKVFDFGLAMESGPDRSRVTKTGQPIGTPRYMSPEQLIAGEITPASDVYSIGIIGFELLYGVDALAGSSWGAQLERMNSGYNFGIPSSPDAAWLAAQLSRMTERNASTRIPNATAAGNLLRNHRFATNSAPTKPRRGFIQAAAAALSTAAIATFLLSSRGEAPLAPQPETALRATPLLRSTQPARADNADPVDVGSDDDDGTVELRSTGCLTGERPKPLVVLLAGDYEPAELLRQRSGFLDVNQGFVRVVAPADTYNDGTFKALRSQLGGFGMWREREDIAQMRTAIIELTTSECIDLSRVFVVGQADGAGIALGLLCQEDSVVSAAAVHAYSFPKTGRDEDSFHCTKPRPLIWLSPMNTSFASKEPGDKTCGGSQKLTVGENKALLLSHRNCATAPDLEREGANTCQVYNCEQPFVWCELDGGRTFPGVPIRKRPGRCKAESGARYDATARIWQFFEQVASQSDDLDAIDRATHP